MLLSCPGRIQILEIEYAGVKAAKNTKKKFIDYCDKNSQQALNIRRCTVSLKLVYKEEYPQDELTQILYKCKTLL